MERIKVDEGVMQYCLEMAGYDLRSAVTQLQFLSNLIFTHNLERLTVNDLQQKYATHLPLGQPQQGGKDQHSTLFQVADWILFNKPQ